MSNVNIDEIQDMTTLLISNMNDRPSPNYQLIHDLDHLIDEDEMNVILQPDECIMQPQPTLYDIPNNIEQQHETSIPAITKLQVTQTHIMNHNIISGAAVNQFLNQNFHQNLQSRLIMLNTFDGQEQCHGTATNTILQQPDHAAVLLSTFHEPIHELRINIMDQVKSYLTKSTPPKIKMRIHFDGGANCSVTNQLDILYQYEQLPFPMPIGGAHKDTPALYATGRGYFGLVSDNGLVIPTPIYYCSTAEGTILSMTDIVLKNKDIFDRWLQYTYPFDNVSTLQLRGNGDTAHINCIMKNGLTYYEMPTPKQITIDKSSIGDDRLTIRAMNSSQKYELWHQRLVHPGDRTMSTIHEHVDGIPKLIKNPFYKCGTCIKSKLSKQVKHSKTNKVLQVPIDINEYFDEDELQNILSTDCVPGQHIHADFGFVRGSEFSEKDEDNKTITSIQGYNSYLIIVDKATRLLTVFLRADKQPAIEEFKQYMKIYGCKDATIVRTVRTDQGGELWGSHQFQETIQDLGYILEPTGADSSFQNGLAENPNKNLAAMMRSLLYNAGLSSKFWCFALMHAVYVKNRLPHRSINMTPFQARTGKRPDLSQLRIFGCHVYVRKPGKRKAKTDLHYYKGLFLGYTSTNRNIHYYDLDSKQIKIASHVIFDEAGMTIHNESLTPGYKALQHLGYDINHKITKDIILDEGQVNIQLLSDHATLPTRGSTEAAGYDITSTGDYTIYPGTIQLIPTDIALQCPEHTYCRIAPRSGLTIKQNLDVKGGVIDRDYTGNVTVIMHNFGTQPATIRKGDKIAQLIFEQIKTPIINEVLTLQPTQRGDNGFGSTDTPIIATTYTKHINKNIDGADITDSDESIRDDLQQLIDNEDVPYTISLSRNRYDNELKLVLEVLADDKNHLCGMTVEEHNGKVILRDIRMGTSAAKIPKWRSTIRNADILKINDIPINTIKQIEDIIQETKLKGRRNEIIIIFGTEERIAIHPVSGVPQLYFDQLNLVDNHLQEIRKELRQLNQTKNKIIRQLNCQLYDITQINQKFYNTLQIRLIKSNITPSKAKLTRRILQKRPDWPEWKQSEAKQLNAYETQNMFGEPCELPPNSNVLSLLWTYLVKVDGTKKARCVCNGSPKSKGTVTLDETYAGSLEQTGSRIFWALTASKNFIAVGADVSNAFAEAGAPKAPLYVYIDKQYREWYTEKTGKVIDPRHNVLPVQRALQGHPESSRLWAKLINKLLINMGFMPCHHEPCLYKGIIDGEEILFLRQVDDFALSSKHESTCNKLITKIQEQMSMEVHHLGKITWFNGIDIQQTRDYIQINVHTYIEKILSRQQWMDPNHKQHKHPLPMQGENRYTKILEQAVPPVTDKEKEQLSHEMGMSYRQAIGELIYVMVTGRPDISYPLIKLSQYSVNPAKEHYTAVKDIFYYLDKTRTDGIYYWRTEPRTDLPFQEHPPIHHDNYEFNSDYTKEDANIMIGASDATWGEDTNHRRSVNGIVLKLSGGAIYYKSNFQKVVSLSTTESEFTAACEAGKAILYIRSILQDLDIPQEAATVLYQDNSGAFYMGNAGKPSKRARHIDIKTKALEQWIEEDLIHMMMINTNENYADAMTKMVGRQLFYRHFDNIMGRRKPIYVEKSKQQNLSITNDYPIKGSYDFTNFMSALTDRLKKITDKMSLYSSATTILTAS